MAAQTPMPPFRLNIEECLRFLARDPAWPCKLGLGVLWSLLGFTIIGAFFVQGYMLLTMERVARAEPLPLPEWNDYGGLLRRGWRGFLLNVIYSLPVILLSILIGILLIGFITALISTITNGGGSSPFQSPAMFAPIALLIAIPFIMLAVLYGFLLSLFLPALLARLVLSDNLVAALDTGAAFAFIRRNLGQYAVAVALNFGAGLLLGGLSFGVNFTPRGGSGRQFWAEPLFLIAIVATLLLIAVRTIAGFFVQLCFSHLLGQLCWYDRQVTARRADGD